MPCRMIEWVWPPQTSIIAQGRVIAQGTIPEVIHQAGAATLEDAFVALVGPADGLGHAAGASP